MRQRMFARHFVRHKLTRIGVVKCSETCVQVCEKEEKDAGQTRRTELQGSSRQSCPVPGVTMIKVMASHRTSKKPEFLTKSQ
jgi:hypothetical protein